MFKILIVEDDKNINKLLKFHLHNAGFRVITRYNVTEGLKAAIEERPDVILSDYQMPDKNGKEFCKLIRSQQNIADTPFIVITGKGSHELKTNGLSKLFDDYLEKPVDMPYLIAKINAIKRRLSTG